MTDRGVYVWGLRTLFPPSVSERGHVTTFRILRGWGREGHPREWEGSPRTSTEVRGDFEVEVEV